MFVCFFVVVFLCVYFFYFFFLRIWKTIYLILLLSKTMQNKEEIMTLKVIDSYSCVSGIICHDPMMRTITQSRRNLDVAAKMAARAKVSGMCCVNLAVLLRKSLNTCIEKRTQVSLCIKV